MTYTYIRRMEVKLKSLNDLVDSTSFSPATIMKSEILGLRRSC